ncbi:MAG: hypothetical protein ABIV36_16860 [Sphingobium limneticum]
MADDAAWRQLEEQLMVAHERGDTETLIAIYVQAADIVEAQGRGEAACFYLTQAYVLALETGAEEAALLDRRLIGLGSNR